MSGAENRVAIVTGGSRGIGRAVALLLAERGYTVCLSYVSDAAAAQDVVDAIAAQGGHALAVKGDVGDEADVIALFKAADGLGRLAALVNNAGVVDVKSDVADMSVTRLQRMMTTNVVGSFLCAREAVRRMSTKRGGAGGAIVNLSSVAARLGGPGQFVDYAASKGALISYAKTLAVETGKRGVTVNIIAPAVTGQEVIDALGQFYDTNGPLPVQWTQ